MERALQWGARHGQPAVVPQRPAGQDIEGPRFTQPEALDQVEAVEFRRGGGVGRQIPAGRWCGGPPPVHPVHKALRPQNPVNRGDGRHRCMRMEPAEGRLHDRRPDEAQIIARELTAQAAQRGASRTRSAGRHMMRAGRAIGPVHVVQPL
jgi:hypothetical protein